MIRKIRVQQFMSIKDVTLTLGRINILIGPTDIGKSVLMRAIDAIVSNRYPASVYAQHGTNKYAISILTERGLATLVKSSSAQYKTNIGGKEELFNAVGRAAPDLVKEVLNMPELPISDTETLDVLYQAQHKPFFLITENRDTFSKVIALISNADKLRDLEKSVNSDILIEKRRITTLKDVIADYDESIALKEGIIESLGDYEDMKKIVDTVQLELTAISEKKAGLKKVEAEMLEMEAQLKKTKAIPLDIVALNTALKTAVKVADLEEQFNLAVTEIPEKIELPEFVADKVELLKEQVKVAYAEIPEKVEATFRTEQLSELKKAFAELSIETPKTLILPEFKTDKIQELVSTLLSIDQHEASLEELEEVRASIQEELKAFDGQVCPTCGNIMSFNHKHEE